MSRTLMMVAALTAACAGAAQAQKPCSFLCAPVFVAQPGLVITNAIGAPAGATSSTNLNLRFTTVVPTQLSRLALVALFQLTPGVTANDPGIAYGGVITLLRPQDTGGWLDVAFDPLGVYSPAPPPSEAGEGHRHYNNKLDLEGNVGLHLFQSLRPSSYLHGVTVYGLLDYLATGVASGSDRWVILTGLTLPLAPWPR